MAVLALLEDLARGMRQKRVFRDNHDFLAHDDPLLISHFRLPKAILLDICAELAPTLERRTRRNRSTPLQVLSWIFGYWDVRAQACRYHSHH